METPVPGFRVIRGPDWTYKNQDGGKGYAGTVLRLHDERQPHFPKLSVLIQWDSGDKGLYRAGYDQAFDIRIIDTANAVCHPKVWCDGCDVDEIRGIRWRCTECYAIDLCTTCYMNDQHDLSHIFMRVLSSDKTSMGPKMLPRSSSPRVALRGSFAGAKVVRLPQWHKRLESDELLGTVIQHGQTLEDKVNVQAVVEFSCGRERLDFTKIFCTLPGSGGYVYAGHLPNLGDRGPVKEGDKVLVTATPAELEILHKRRGLWEPEMAKTFRKEGFVNRRTNTGDFTVTFHDSQETFTMNSAALRKIHPLCLGQLVRIGDTIEIVNGGRTAAMKQAIGKVGKVVEIDGSDIHVRFKDNNKFIFNSANLTPERNRASDPEGKTNEGALLTTIRIMQDPEWSIVVDLEAGDIEAVERKLAIHPEWIHYEPYPGFTLLGHIAGNDDVHMMKFLVEKGAFVESYYCAPLFHATLANKYRALEYLLDQGADVHAISPQGLTCLSLACAEGFFQCAHYLLMHGADLNNKEDGNITPVHQSLKSGGRTIVDLVMDRQEADLKAVTSTLASVMHSAAGSDNTYAMTKLLDKIPRLVEARDDKGKTPLFSAVFIGSRDAAELLIKKGHCNVNAVESLAGSCPLALAIYLKNFQLVDVLMKHGADVNLQNHSGNTSLQIALNVRGTRGQNMKEEPYMAEMKRKWGHIGIKTNSDALLAFLVSHGGDLNAYNSDRMTIKTMIQHQPILQPLLEIQSQRGKIIARIQSTANRPLSNLTPKTIDTGTEVNAVSSLSKKSTARPGTEKQRSGTSSEKLVTGSGSQQKSSEELVGSTARVQVHVEQTDTRNTEEEGKEEEEKKEEEEGEEEEDRIAVESLSHVTDEVNFKPNKMECCKRVGVEGDKLQLDTFGIELEIPPGAIDSEAPQDIYLRVLTDTPNLGISKEEMSVCFGVQCLAPHDLVLKLPVTYTIPHCAVITRYSSVEAVLYTGEGEYSPDAEVKEQIPLTQSGIPNCNIERDLLRLQMNHFSWAFIRFKLNVFFGGKRLRCLPFAQQQLPEERTPVILRAYLYDGVKGSKEIASQEEEIGFAHIHPEAEVLIRVAEVDVKMTCFIKDVPIGNHAAHVIFPL